jgi:hypothetical protein
LSSSAAIPKRNNVFISVKKEREPLQGYWDISSNHEHIINRYRRDNVVFDPANNEKQASQLIDLPTALARNTGYSTDYSEDKRYRFRDPYSDKYKNRLANAWYFDAVINQAIVIRSSNILGKNMRTVLEADPYIILGTDVAPAKALSDVINEAEQKKLMDYIKRVERITGIYDKYESLILDHFIGGRSAKYMQPANKEAMAKYELPEGTPTHLIDLEWQRLGQIKLDKDDNIEKIEYRDASKFPVNDDTTPEDEKGYAKFLDYEKLIYYPRNDRFYGRSIIQTILSCSEQNRMMNDQDLPEITKARWAPSMLFWSKEMSVEELQDFLEDRDPAKDSAVRAEIHSEKLQTEADPGPLSDLRVANVQFMIMQLDVPSFLMKMENVTNRATVVSVLATWRNLTLENDREKFRRAMWSQFYKKLVKLHFKDTADFDILTWDAQIGFIFNNLSVTDDESESKVIDILQKHGIESPRESRRRMNLPPEMEEVDAMETVLGNKQNAEEIDKSKEEIEDLAAGARDDVIALMKKKGMPQAMIDAAEKHIKNKGTLPPEEEE